ncbi:hypothetical protein PAF17_12875, partial [Paracoccus sp. Z330]
GDLRDRVTLELGAEIAFAHLGLLASKLGKKASTNLGAIQKQARERQLPEPYPQTLLMSEGSAGGGQGRTYEPDAYFEATRARRAGSDICCQVGISQETFPVERSGCRFRTTAIG